MYTTVVLAIYPTVTANIGNIKQALRIFVILTASVDLQFHAHKQRTRTVKDRLGLIIVLVNAAAFQLRVATLAVRQVFVVIVMRVVVVNDSAAFFAGRVVIVPATYAERDVIVTLHLVAPDPLPTVVANRRSFLKTSIAKNAIFKDLILVLLYGNSATGTVNFFAHSKSLLYGLFWIFPK
jgi:hypothetical protein